MKKQIGGFEKKVVEEILNSTFDEATMIARSAGYNKFIPIVNATPIGEISDFYQVGAKSIKTLMVRNNIFTSKLGQVSVMGAKGVRKILANTDVPISEREYEVVFCNGNTEDAHNLICVPKQTTSLYSPQIFLAVGFLFRASKAKYSSNSGVIAVFDAVMNSPCYERAIRSPKIVEQPEPSEEITAVPVGGKVAFSEEFFSVMIKNIVKEAVTEALAVREVIPVREVVASPVRAIRSSRRMAVAKR